MPDTTVLLLPGLWDSGPQHWQSHWEAGDPTIQRVRQRDWETPDRREWVATLDDAIAATPGVLVLVGHSTGCLLAAHWAATASDDHLARVRGALLVAPSDPDRSSYPPGPTGWTPVPMQPLPFASIVVASTNDEYVSLDRAREFAEAWGSLLVNAGALGHINSASDLGPWPAGQALLRQLRD